MTHRNLYRMMRGALAIILVALLQVHLCVSTCPSTPCENNGVCVSSACECAVGYIDDYCTRECSALNLVVAFENSARVPGGNWTAWKTVVGDILGKVNISDSAVAVISFSDTQTVHAWPGDYADHAALNTIVDGVAQSVSSSVDFTNLVAYISGSVLSDSRLNQTLATPAILALTYGSDTVGGDISAQVAVAEALYDKIQIIVVGVGTATLSDWQDLASARLDRQVYAADVSSMDATFVAEVFDEICSVPATTGLEPMLLGSCEDLHTLGLRRSSMYTIDPDLSDGYNSIKVWCDMSASPAVAHVFHNQMTRTELSDSEAAFSDERPVYYDGQDTCYYGAIRALVTSSSSCQYWHHLYCHNMLPSASAYITYFGNYSTFGSNGEYCPDGGTCNCYTEGSWQVDDGYITSDHLFPIRTLAYGDLGYYTEMGYYWMGPLECTSDTSYCSSDPCRNGGTCYGGETVSCICATNFTGDFCETKLNSPEPPLGTFMLLIPDGTRRGIAADWGNGTNENYVLALSASPQKFKLSPCLGGIEGNFVAIESVLYPGSYLRHKSYTIWLHPATDSEYLGIPNDVMAMGGCFMAVPSTSTANAFSFWSYNFPDYAITVAPGEIRMQTNATYMEWNLYSPVTCQDILDGDASAVDGEYEFSMSGVTIQVYCHNMSGTPAEFISLSDAASNYGEDNSSRTEFSKIRLDTQTMRVILDDYTFGNLTGSVNQPLGGAVVSSAVTRTAMVDLSGTGLRVNRDGSVWLAYNGSSVSETWSDDNQTVTVQCSGCCGHCQLDGGILELEADTRSVCERSPCENGGTCLDSGDTYRCVCKSENLGRNCTLMAGRNDASRTDYSTTYSDGQGTDAANDMDKQTCVTVGKTATPYLQFSFDHDTGDVQEVKITLPNTQEDTCCDPSLTCSGTDTTELDCPGGYVISIEFAMYGRAYPAEAGCSYSNSDVNYHCDNPHAGEEIKAMCNGQQNCLIDPTVVSCADPCPNIEKYTYVNYTCTLDALGAVMHISDSTDVSVVGNLGYALVSDIARGTYSFRFEPPVATSTLVIYQLESSSTMSICEVEIYREDDCETDPCNENYECIRDNLQPSYVCECAIGRVGEDCTTNATNLALGQPVTASGYNTHTHHAYITALTDGRRCKYFYHGCVTTIEDTASAGSVWVAVDLGVSREVGMVRLSSEQHSYVPSRMNEIQILLTDATPSTAMSSGDYVLCAERHEATMSKDHIELYCLHRPSGRYVIMNNHQNSGFVEMEVYAGWPCMGSPCYGGTCVEDALAGTFTCLCENGTYGEFCQLGSNVAANRVAYQSSVLSEGTSWLDYDYFPAVSATDGQWLTRARTEPETAPWFLIDLLEIFYVQRVVLIDKGPATCTDIALEDPSAEDGHYWIYHSSGPIRVYCHNITYSPSAYLTLQDPSLNFGLNERVTNEGKTEFSKVRFNETTLHVHIYEDYTFSQTLYGVWQPFGFAGDCNCGDRLGLASIDFSGTGFKVDRDVTTWEAAGNNAGIADQIWSNNDQTATFTCGGCCGHCQPMAGNIMLERLPDSESDEIDILVGGEYDFFNPDFTSYSACISNVPIPRPWVGENITVECWADPPGRYLLIRDSSTISTPYMGFAEIEVYGYQELCWNGTCQNNGTCKLSNDYSSFLCTCALGYVGEFCQYVDLCYVDPCHNGATCFMNEVSGASNCTCPSGYFGNLCNITDDCYFADPCINNGTCVTDLITGEASCNCTLEYIGEICFYPNPCLSDPCTYNGTCVENGTTGAYTCDCPPTRAGPICEFHIDDLCQFYPCGHGENGPCYHTYDYNSYYCDCYGFVTGINCDDYYCSMEMPVERHTPFRNDFAYTLLALYPNASFSCSGEMVGVYLKAQDTGVFWVSVWDDIGNDTFQLMDSVRIQVNQTGVQQIFFGSHSLLVIRNYILGIYYESFATASNVLHFVDSRDDVSGTGLSPANLSVVQTAFYFDESLVNGVQLDPKSWTMESFTALPTLQPLVVPAEPCVKASLPSEYYDVATRWTIGMGQTVELDVALVEYCNNTEALLGSVLVYEWFVHALDIPDSDYVRIPSKYYGAGYSSTLKVSARYFGAGMYRLKVLVDRLQSEDEMYMEVVQLGLVAIIRGGTGLSLRVGQPLILDAASMSYDPDDVNNLFGPLNYTWSATVGRVPPSYDTIVPFDSTNATSEIIGVFSQTNSTVILDTTGWPLQDYTFRLGISKDIRKAFYDQAIYLVDGNIPDISIRCLVNCEVRALSNTKLSLNLLCPECLTLTGMTYEWKLMELVNGTWVPVDLEPISYAGIYGESMVIRPWTLKEDTPYYILLILNCDSCAECYAEYKFTTNAPPYGGYCYASPTSGEALTTNFRFFCSDWMSAAGPLIPISYRFVSVSSSGSESLIFYGYQSATQGLTLGVGEAPDYNRTIRAEVLDAYGAVTLVNISVVVTAPTLTSGAATALLDDLDNLVFGNNSKKASAMISSFSSILNSDSGTGLTAAEDEAIVDSLLGSLESLSGSIDNLEGAVSVAQVMTSLVSERPLTENSASTAATSASLMAQSVPGLLVNNAEAAVDCVTAVLSSTMFIEASSTTGSAGRNNSVDTDGANQARNNSGILEAAKDILLDSVAATLAPGEDAFVTEVRDTVIMVKRDRMKAYANHTINTTAGGIILPDNTGGVEANTLVDMKFGSTTSNPYTWSDTTGLQGMFNIKFQDEAGNPRDLNSTISLDILSLNDTVPSVQVDLYDAMDLSTGMIYHEIEVDSANMSIVMELVPPNTEFEVYLQHGHRPTLDNYTYMTMLYADVKEMLAETALIQLTIPPQYSPEAGTYYLAVRPDLISNFTDTSTTRKKRSTSNISNYTLAMTTKGCRSFDPDFDAWVASGAVDENSTDFSTLRCAVNVVPERSSYGGSVIAAPNMIDFTNVWANFANIAENLPVTCTVGMVLIIYVLLLVWSRRNDRKDTIRWEHEELEDNQPNRRFRYRLTVDTVLGWGAGTRSNAYFILYGATGNTGKRKLCGAYNKEFPSASTRTFILRTSRPLGHLRKLHLWHDNSGKGGYASWTIDTIQIDDFQSKKSYDFIFKRCLSTTSEDGCKYTARFARPQDTSGFRYLFSKTSRTKIMDGHMWFSVFLIPFRSTFTRVQRLTCCMTGLFLTMIVSAMFYGTSENVESPFTLRLGPIVITVHELYVSAVSLVIVIPVNLLIVQIFRSVNVRTRRENIQQLLNDDSCPDNMHQIKHNGNNDADKEKAADSPTDSGINDTERHPEDILEELFVSHTAVNDNKQISEEDVRRLWSRKTVFGGTKEPMDTLEGQLDDIMDYLHHVDSKGSDRVSTHKDVNLLITGEPEEVPDTSSTALSVKSDYYNEDELWSDLPYDEDEEDFKDAPRQKGLPSCCLGVAWILAVLAIITPAFFIILYSMDWGPEVSNAWLVSYVLSFAESLLISDPIKVVILAFLATVLLRRASAKRLPSDEEEHVEDKDDDDVDEEKKEAQKRRAELVKQARAALKELIAHVFFIWIVVSLSYGSNDSNSYLLNRTIKDQFVDTFKTKVSTMSHYFTWLDTCFVPNYFVITDYNNVLLSYNDRKYLGDMSSFRVGPAALRQVRTKEVTCREDQFINEICIRSYAVKHESHEPFGLGELNWTVYDASLYSTVPAWYYQSASSLDGVSSSGNLATYGGGGFVATLDVSRTLSVATINELKQYKWLDRYTRGIFLEFTVYNPNIDLFAVTNLIAEKGPTGGVITDHNIQIFRAYGLGAFTIYIYLCCFIFFIFYIGYIVVEIGNLKELKFRGYFTRVKSYLNLAIIVLGSLMISFYIYRWVELNRTMSAMQQDMDRYLPFRNVASIDDMYKYCVAFINAVAILKMILLFRLHQRFSSLMSTMKAVMAPLGSYFILMVALLLAYTGSGVIMYGPYLEDFRHAMASMQSLLNFAMGSFDVESMMSVDKLYTPLYFLSFMILMNMLMLNVMVAIIMDTHEAVQGDPSLQMNDHELVRVMFAEFFNIATTVTRATDGAD